MKDFVIREFATKDLFPKQNYTHKLLDISCFMKVERNGIEVTKSLPQQMYKLEVFEIRAGPKYSMEYLFKKQKSDDIVFNFSSNDIVKTFDKFIHEEKFTFSLNKGQKPNEIYSVFLFKTNSLILDSLKKAIDNFSKGNYYMKDNVKKNELNSSSTVNSHNLMQKGSNNLDSSNIKIVQNKLNTQNTITPITAKIEDQIKEKYNRKRKYQEFLKNPQKVIDDEIISREKHLIELNKIHKNANSKKVTINDLPLEMSENIFSFLDFKNKLKFNTVNKQVNDIYYQTTHQIIFHELTDSKMYVRILAKYKSLESIDFGKAKNLINQSVNDFYTLNLKNLKELKINEITCLNDISIQKMLKPMKNLKSIKLNFSLDGFISAIHYFDYLPKIEEIHIVGKYKKIFVYPYSKVNELYNEIISNPNNFNRRKFESIKTVINKKSIKNFSICHWSLHSETLPNLNHLVSLNIDLLVIVKLEDLFFVKEMANLASLSISHITMLYEKRKEMLLQNKTETLNLQEIEMIKADFPEDSIELLTRLFTYLRKLTTLKLGQFSNNIFVKLISLFLTNLERLSLSSFEITDDFIPDILNNLTKLEYLDLKGSSRINGECFFSKEIRMFPKNLRHISTNIVNISPDIVFNFLTSKGIFVENYQY